MVAACFKAFADRDVERFLELVHEDVKWRPASTLLAPEPGAPRVYEGHDGVRQWFVDAASWTGYTVKTYGFHADGDRVLVPAVATLAREAMWLTRAVYFVFTVRDGKVSDLCSWKREDEAREHAELPPAEAALAPDAVEGGALQVEADPSQLREVRGRLREAAQWIGMDPVCSNDLLVAVTEAVTNAITHGRPDEDGTIGLQWGVEEDMLAVCVEDRGQFNPEQDPQSPRVDHGRGIAVMRLLVDELTIEARRGLTRVRLAKRLSPA